MPLIVVYNLSQSDFKEEGKIEKIEEAIFKAIRNTPELELTLNDVSWSFPQDPTISSNKIMVSIIVELLFDKPKRTLKVRQDLARRIAEAFRSVPGNEARKVEVAVKRFDPEKDGFYIVRE